MARIPDGVIERLKAEISVQRLAETRGVLFTRHGADLIGRCPFHQDKTPSLVVTPAKNLWHCLGACQVGGTVIDWVMRAEGISFRHAVELLQNDSLPSAAAASVTLPKQSTVKKLPTTLARDLEDARLLVQVIDYYHQSLGPFSNPSPLEDFNIQVGFGHGRYTVWMIARASQEFPVVFGGDASYVIDAKEFKRESGTGLDVYDLQPGARESPWKTRSAAAIVSPMSGGIAVVCVAQSLP
jgi:hypothetical protein